MDDIGQNLKFYRTEKLPSHRISPKKHCQVQHKPNGANATPYSKTRDSDYLHQVELSHPQSLEVAKKSLQAAQLKDEEAAASKCSMQMEAEADIDDAVIVVDPTEEEEEEEEQEEKEKEECQPSPSTSAAVSTYDYRPLPVLSQRYYDPDERESPPKQRQRQQPKSDSPSGAARRNPADEVFDVDRTSTYVTSNSILERARNFLLRPDSGRPLSAKLKIGLERIVSKKRQSSSRDDYAGVGDCQPYGQAKRRHIADNTVWLVTLIPVQ